MSNDNELSWVRDLGQDDDSTTREELVAARSAAGQAAREEGDLARAEAAVAPEVEVIGEETMVEETSAAVDEHGDWVKSLAAPVVIAAEPEPDTTPRRRWRRPALIASAATVLVLGAGGGIALGLVKDVTVQADGRTVVVSTFAGDVNGALAAAEIAVGPYDDVVPALGGPVADGDTIVIDRARLVSVSLDDELHETWTTAATLDEALNELGVAAGAGERLELSADAAGAIPEAGLKVEAKITFPVTVTDGTTASKEIRTDGDTVADVLAADGITLTKLDRVTPAVQTALKPGLKITIDRVVVTTVTEQVAVAQLPDTQVEEATLDQGKTEVATQGAPGQESVTYQVTSVNGAETERAETGRVLDLAPTGSVIKVGTRVPDPSEKYADPANWSTNWDGIARCESTNNWAINTGNGYYGGLQFDRGTWLGAGGGVYGATANLATKEQQIYIAEKVFASRGLQPWACGHAG